MMKSIVYSSTTIVYNSFVHIMQDVLTRLHAVSVGARVAATFTRVVTSVMHLTHHAQYAIFKGIDIFCNIVDNGVGPKSIAIVLVLYALVQFLRKTTNLDDRISNTISKVLEQGESINVRRNETRKIFRETTLANGRLSQNVLHPQPKLDRKRAMSSVTSMIQQLPNYEPFYVQPRPEQAVHSNSMTHYWVSDTAVPTSNDKVTDEHIVVRIDSDYYEDLNRSVTYNPHLIYTFDPTQAAAQATEYPAWTFVDAETLEVTSPAEQYRHNLWDYTAKEFQSFKLNCVYNAEWASFEVEKRRVCKTHSLVALIPRVRYTGIYAFLACTWYGVTSLKRVNVGDTDYAVMEVLEQRESDKTVSYDHTISVARKNTHLAATTSMELFNQAYELARGSKLGSTIPKIKSKLKMDDGPAAVLRNYLQDTRDTTNGEFSRDWYKNYRVEYGVKTYQMYPNTAEVEPRPSLIPFAYPIVDGAFAPSRSLASEKAAIEGRLSKLTTNLELTPKHVSVMCALIKRMVPNETLCNVLGKHQLEPCDDDTVFEKQPSPSQQQILEVATEMNFSNPMISSFVKKEAYQKISDPRIISTLKPADKLENSKFLYPFADWLKKQKWYAFGKTPRKIAQRLAKIARKSDSINCTDFTRMDGHKNHPLRQFNYTLMCRLFKPEFVAAIRDMCQRSINSRGVTLNYDDECYFYKTFLAWASGNPFTSGFNSIDNAVIVFTGYINVVTDSGKLEMTEARLDEAYALLLEKAILAGDDTALGDMPDRCIVNAAKWWGHVLKSNVYMRGDSGVDFLARKYGPDLWYGEENSCTDLMRALAKIHTAPNLAHFTPVQKLEMKLTSLWYTDRNSPIFKQLLERWLSVGGKLAEKYNSTFMSYWSRYDIKDQYPNESEEWMLEFLPDVCMDDLFEYLEKAETPEAFLTLPCIYVVEPLPHKQQTIIEINGEQEELGEPETAVDEPLEQEILIPAEELVLDLGETDVEKATHVPAPKPVQKAVRTVNKTETIHKPAKAANTAQKNTSRAEATKTNTKSTTQSVKVAGNVGKTLDKGPKGKEPVRGEQKRTRRSAAQRFKENYLKQNPGAKMYAANKAYSVYLKSNGKPAAKAAPK